jgi:hypothetical protein
MRIYGVQIVMPHSGSLTRSQVLTLLHKAVKNNYSGVGNYDRSITKVECERHYNSLHIEDVNNDYRTTLY